MVMLMLEHILTGHTVHVMGLKGCRMCIVILHKVVMRMITLKHLQREQGSAQGCAVVFGGYSASCTRDWMLCGQSLLLH